MSLSARSGCQKSIKDHADEHGWAPRATCSLRILFGTHLSLSTLGPAWRLSPHSDPDRVLHPTCQLLSPHGHRAAVSIYSYRQDAEWLCLGACSSFQAPTPGLLSQTQRVGAQGSDFPVPCRPGCCVMGPMARSSTSRDGGGDATRPPAAGCTLPAR